MSKYLNTVLLILFGLTGQAADQTASDVSALSVYPQQIKLDGKRQRQQIVVTGVLSNKNISDVTDVVTYAVSDPSVLRISKSGRVVPISDGQATITVQLGSLKQSIQATVANQSSPDYVSFDYHTLPALAKAGCSGGSCHGAPHGKAGFQLSLFASDPSLDRKTLTRESQGRRINMNDPDESLLLRKPTMRVAHLGGRRIDRGDELYTLLRDWIGEGCRVDSSPVKCVGIDVFPKNARVLYEPHKTQHYSVQARFSDGSIRDVTHLAKFETSDPNVAEVTRDGKVVGIDRGETAVIIRYLEFIQAPILTFVRDIDGFTWDNTKTKNYIDEHVHAKLRQLQYLPSGLSNDEVFLRRVYLDVIGLLPSREEAERFLADKSADKRARLIDELLQRPEYAMFWAQKWADLLRISKRLLGGTSVYKYNRWLRGAVSTNMRYDQFARELLTASGSTLTHPSGNYFRTAADTNDAMETTAQLFLGTRIQCAKCHNHPFERWTQDNYYGMAAVFNRIQRRKMGQDEVFLYTQPHGEVTNPRTGQPAKPWVPSQGELPVAPADDRREAFANWLTSKANPFFARVEVNRIWAQVMGRGIVEPFDDFRDSNPPSNAPLLDALAADFVAHSYDREHILKTILNSRTYQTSSRSNDFNRDDFKYFSHYIPRRLTAEQIVDALGQVTEQPKQFQFVPRGTKATWLPAPDLKPYDRRNIGDIEFLKVFGQPERQSVCECDRGDESSLSQALEILNGRFFNDMLSHPGTRFRKSISTGLSDAEIVVDLYLNALSRRPSPRELQASIAYIKSHEDRGVAMEDVCWAILSKQEFLFQH